MDVSINGAVVWENMRDETKRKANQLFGIISLKYMHNACLTYSPPLLMPSLCFTWLMYLAPHLVDFEA